jgi:FdrA protein
VAFRWLIRPNTYHDSVKLMRLSETLTNLPGVSRAAAVMATPLNVDLLSDDGLLPAEVHPSPDDLLVSVVAADEASADAALSRIDELLTARESSQELDAVAPHTLEQAGSTTELNLAVIAVPGPQAALEAYAALRAGLHVFLFSDNVPIDDEIQLKSMAADRDLLMMGPDCGTAIINGVGLGFANRVDRGSVGIVGASGTGIQQLCCLLDTQGIGIAQAIGTGGRDLSAGVSGSMTRRALRMLEEDDTVAAIAVVSKPADAGVAHQLHEDLLTLTKPVAVCLLGASGESTERVRYASTLTDLARIVGVMVGGALSTGEPDPPLERQHAGFRSRVYGLYSGGTLCSEAGQILDRMNVIHTLVDMGSDRFTRGRAHPMIDPRLRASTLADVARHGDAGALLIDVVLGDLAHPDPAGALVPALQELRSYSDMPLFAVLVGTRRDPQGLERQRQILEDADVRVFAGNAHAAAAAGAVLGGDV